VVYVNATSDKPQCSGDSDYGPPYTAFWVLFSALLTFMSSGLLLSVYALALAVIGALLATWTAIALKRRAARQGRRQILAPLWIVLVGISPSVLLWASAFSPLNAR